MLNTKDPDLRRMQDILLACIQSADPRMARSAMDDWVASRGLDGLVEGILLPVLGEFSSVHASAVDYPIAKAYVAAIIAEDCMALAARGLGKPAAAGTRGPVILGNIEDDFHALGRSIVCTFLRCDGWAVIDLGNDVAAAGFVDAAIAHDASVIGVSAMILPTARTIRSVRTEIDNRGRHGRIALAVGGAVFNLRPDLAAEVGADGTCSTALGASQLFATLDADVRAGARNRT